MVIVYIVCIILFLFVLVTLFIGNFFFNMALKPKISKNYIRRNLICNIKFEDIENDKKWINEFGEEINIISSDNLKLKGYKIKNPIKKSDIWVILLHGYMGCALELVGNAKKFINMGYNILLIDLRAHGKSEGKYIGMGWKDKDDLLLWINKLCTENKNCRIILYGVSMGAATVMMVSGENLKNNVKVIIEDCGYSSIKDEYESILKYYNPVISKFVMFSVNLVTKIKLGYSIKEASCIKQVQKSNIPILFIHGESDTFVPYNMLEKIYNAKKEPKEILTVKGAGHTKSCKIEPNKYWNKVEEFTKKYL